MALLLRPRRGVRGGTFRWFARADGPALFEAGARDLRTYTFLPWSRFVHSTPGVSHDNPTYRRYHGADTVEPSGPMTEATGQNGVVHFGDDESFQPGFRLAGVRAGRRHQAIAEALLAAERDRTPIPGPSEQWREADAGDAYAVQLLGVSARLAAGATLVGHKVGLTSRAMQRRLGIDHPTYGHLLDRMVIPEGEPLSAGALLAPHVEAEVAFVLGSPLSGPGVSPDDVIAATDHLLPALEVLDTRIAGRPSLVDTIADNGSAARFMLGPHKTRPSDVDLAGVLAIMTLNGELVERASTVTELEHPARAVAWLANALAERDVFLDEGHIILSGARSAAVRVSGGDGLGASLGELGSVSLRVAP